MRNIIVDTSSLLALVRYYLPFDPQNKLYNFMKSQFESGSLQVIDAVFEELKYTSQGLILNTLKFLNEAENSKQIINTEEILPPHKFYNMLNNNFKTPIAKKLDEAEFEIQKQNFLKGVDGKMIVYAIYLKHQNNISLIKEMEDTVIITEETKMSNDRKFFKKIPAICQELNIKTMHLPQLLQQYTEIDIIINTSLHKENK